MSSRSDIEFLKSVQHIMPYINQNSFDLYEEYIKRDSSVGDITVQITEDLYSMYCQYDVIKSPEIDKMRLYDLTWTLEKPVIVTGSYNIYGSSIYPVSIFNTGIIVPDSPVTNITPSAPFSNASIDVKYVSKSFVKPTGNKYVGFLSKRASKGDYYLYKYPIIFRRSTWLSEDYRKISGSGDEHINGVISPFTKMVSHRTVAAAMLADYL